MSPVIFWFLLYHDKRNSPSADGEISLTQNRGFAAAAASFFLSDQKETKESPGDVAFGKDLQLTPWSFMSHFPPVPRFYGGVRCVVGSRGRRGDLLNGV